MKSTIFLLIEDDPNDVFFVQQAFKEAPSHLRLCHVGDGREGLRYINGEGEYSDRRKHPVPNVILLDLKMPGLSGFDFLHWLRTQAPEPLRLIPVIVMSSSALREDVSRSYMLGAAAYMTKPVDFGAFKERIKFLGIFWGEHVKTPEASATPATNPVT